MKFKQIKGIDLDHFAYIYGIQRGAFESDRSLRVRLQRIIKGESALTKRNFFLKWKTRIAVGGMVILAFIIGWLAFRGIK